VANELKTFSVGPWKLGQNNKEESNADVFQLPNPNALFPQEGIPQVTSAINVDFDVDGRISRRDGLTDWIVADSEIYNIFSHGNVIYYQDGGSIKTFNINSPNDITTVVTGLASERIINFCYHAGQIFYTNGVQRGRIASGVGTNWGCELTSIPTLEATFGTLRPGQYMVAVECVDANSVVHASSGTGFILVGEEKNGIRVSVNSVDPNASKLRVFLAGPDDDVLYYVDDVKITSLPKEDTTCWTIGLDPPPFHDFAFSYQGRLMLIKDNWVFPSLGPAVHLYDLANNTIGYPETILAGAGLTSGFWVVTENNAFWASGDNPQSWKIVDEKQRAKFCKGSLVVSESSIPGLKSNSSNPVALFWSSWGLVIGLNNGEMIFPMKERYNDNIKDKTAHIAYREIGNERQLVCVLSGGE